MTTTFSSTCWSLSEFPSPPIALEVVVRLRTDSRKVSTSCRVSVVSLNTRNFRSLFPINELRKSIADTSADAKSTGIVVVCGVDMVVECVLRCSVRNPG